MKNVNEYIAAGDQRISEKCVKQLANSNNHEIRRRVAENASTPFPVLMSLLADEHPDVRVALSFNPIVQRPFLEQLVEDTDVDVRLGLAENLSLPLDLLRVLSEDENPYVAERAKVTIKIANQAVSQIMLAA